MAPSKPNDVESLGTDISKDIQEKHNLREIHHQAVPENDRRGRRTMDSGRKLLLALLVCCMVVLGLASAHQGRADCHEDAANVDHAAIEVQHSSLSSLLASNSAESLRELLEKYVPERYRQQDSQFAKRQDGNSTVSAVVTTAVTTVSSASTVATTTVQAPASSTTTAATTPTSASVETTVQTVVQTSVQTQDQATATITAIQTPTPSETAASSGTSEVTTPSASAPVVSTPASSSSSSEQRSVSVGSLSNIARHYSGHIQDEPDRDSSRKQDLKPCVVEESGYHFHINHGRWGHLSRHGNLVLLRRRGANGRLID
ncbi:hypothetical protein Daus18300_000865 [Diaporthe australafricana]|uniref:Uncharacterized protein n=1 Tax=Diaporthe australafricana TaxID=127596 RepID=A0ABR3Y1K8_9PEZI